MIGLDSSRPCCMEWSRNLCLWSFNGEASSPPLSSLLKSYLSSARSWDGEQGLIPLGEGVEPYGMPLLPRALVAPRCEENHLLPSCFLVYTSHSPFPVIFSQDVFANTTLKPACWPALSSLTVTTHVWFLFKMPRVSGTWIRIDTLVFIYFTIR